APTGVFVSELIRLATPDDHLFARPDSRVPGASGWGVGGRQRQPDVAQRIIRSAGVELVGRVFASPNHHRESVADRGVFSARHGDERAAGGLPGVGTGVVTTAGIEIRGRV